MIEVSATASPTTLVEFLAPMLRAYRSCGEVDAKSCARNYPGDEYVTAPRWTWTYGIEIEAPPEATWPWVARLGYERRKEARVPVVLHEAGRCLCFAGSIARDKDADGANEVKLSWTFLVEPYGDGQSRFISRFRVAYGEDVAARLEQLLRENGSTPSPGAVALDQGVLRGLKERAESGHETTLRR